MKGSNTQSDVNPQDLIKEKGCYTRQGMSDVQRRQGLGLSYSVCGKFQECVAISGACWQVRLSCLRRSGYAKHSAMLNLHER